MNDWLKRTLKILPFVAGTQIGDTITCYDGIWLSEKACTNLAAAIKIAEQIKKKTLEDVTRRK